MTYPSLPDVPTVASHFSRALHDAVRVEKPYRLWRLKNVMPESMCTGVLVLPIAPLFLGNTDGTRNSYNAQRTFFTPRLRQDFPAVQVFAEAMQQPEVARQFAETCFVDVVGSYLRMEYIQDTDGAWLEPHRDIPEKLFSMVIYLCTGPEAKDWGTDIYDDDRKWIGRSEAEFNSATIFKAGPNTWHGFDKRPIIGVRRLFEINYVSPTWRDREQLAFPDQPIALA